MCLRIQAKSGQDLKAGQMTVDVEDVDVDVDVVEWTDKMGSSVSKRLLSRIESWMMKRRWEDGGWEASNET